MGRGDSNNLNSGDVLALRKRAGSPSLFDGPSELDKLGIRYERQSFPDGRCIDDAIRCIQENNAGVKRISDHLAVGYRHLAYHEFFFTIPGYEMPEQMMEFFDAWRLKICSEVPGGNKLIGFSQCLLIGDSLEGSPKVSEFAPATDVTIPSDREEEERITDAVGLLNGAKPIYPPDQVNKMFIERIHPQLIFPLLYVNDEMRKDLFQHKTFSSLHRYSIPTRKKLYDWMTGPLNAWTPEWIGRVRSLTMTHGDTTAKPGVIDNALQHKLHSMFLDELSKDEFDHVKYCLEERHGT